MASTSTSRCSSSRTRRYGATSSARLPTSNTSSSSGSVLPSSGSVLLPFRMELWRHVVSGDMMTKNEASFTTTLRFMIISSRTAAVGSLAFVVVPTLNAADGALPRALNTANYTITTTSNNHSLSLDLASIMSDYNNNSNKSTSTAVNYTVWIDYDGIGHKISAYMANDGQLKPSKAIFAGHLTMSNRVPNKAYIGFFASGSDGETYGLLSWNITVDRVPDSGIAASKSKNKPFETGFTTVIVVFSFFSVSLIVILVFQSKKNSDAKQLLDEVLSQLARKLKYSEIRNATGNFTDARRLGRGSFGVVYMGTLTTQRNGRTQEQRQQQVAVKKFDRDENQQRRFTDFLVEIQVIIRLKHNNIVQLIGWCLEKRALLLVYEYKHNGSLDNHLFGNHSRQQQVLPWPTRYSIVRDVAAGLHYIHHELEDIKSSNILLDQEFRACLGDFGLARVISGGRSSASMELAGTRGFIAPEYAQNRVATRRTDVYAFGALVLEIVTGRKALDHSRPSDSVLIANWVRDEFHNNGKLLEAVDGSLTTEEGLQYDADDAERLLLLGLSCTSHSASDRPSMEMVVQIVAKPVPRPVVVVPRVEPAFVGSSSAEIDDASSLGRR
ncbi:probable serine/threonine-protein kinase PBL1 [Oryza sativa Japonica Group]|uniref:Protein kinase domain-containing protein n=2 Tax=Oryza TaxID=4527 RepID=B8AU95_ORYSI|nr:hypothetical protein OsI_14590 [Oryza sativa Indica Group]KAF2932530.1 hypothetical protein DAI22_04g004300 [Oryza sativa Japonica Group]